ncbi:glycosyltransferase family 9 protein [Dyadobacter chenhuakuii]|uniref:Glycosyltransferase family 9 protein n=1 Tax=Dyadobacter chenhuakuii TaxID=2909339 RepID=A0ABY4XLA7_9BACT|nr:glycosyltransferase family 9 protein [Dyadobacter chenhuakuii]MCF2493844.1 glycosyltransferase family 9 protein [Dyadobacter chenhuakuii]USJ30975.1 glycosyltransferase family 9 protein [Dyadobacter chenhuakuii]
MNKPVKVLILRFSSIGDIVLTTPVIRCLKQQANVEIHYFTKSKFEFLLTDNPYVDKIWLLDKDINPILKQLKAEHFDYIIDLHANIRTLRIKLALGVKAFSFDKLNVLKWLRTTFKVDYLPDIHIVDRYMDTLGAFNVMNDGQGLDYFIPYKDNVETSWLPVTHQQAFVAYAIGGQHNTKKLPVPRMIELCRKINFPTVLLGGKEDFEAGEEIRKAVGDELILNACGKYNFNQSASLIQKSLIVFSHDTGLMHVAAAFKKKVYSIWGNTIPGFGMYPYKTAFEVLENNNLKCRPCSKIGYKACPQKHFKCMNELSFNFPIKELPGNN